jgi:nucleoside-diphosphate-sugar epimerase
MSKDKILVTGAGGEVGSISNKIIIKLRAEGKNVRGFLRKGNKMHLNLKKQELKYIKEIYSI